MPGELLTLNKGSQMKEELPFASGRWLSWCHLSDSHFLFLLFLSCLFVLGSLLKEKKATKPKQPCLLSHLFNSFFLPFSVHPSTQLSSLLECIFYLLCSNKEEELIDIPAFWTFPFCFALLLFFDVWVRVLAKAGQLHSF